MILTANIKLKFQNQKIANDILEVILPDNSPLPSGLEIESIIDDEQLVVNIRCTRGIESFQSTIEDIMSAIDLSIRTTQTMT